MANSDATRNLLDLVERLTGALALATQNSGKILQGQIVHQSYSAGLRASGDFIKSIKLKPVSVGLFKNGIFSGGVYSDDDQEKVETIEFGRKPGSKAPSMFRILQWMTLKGIVPDKQGAYLIARKISQDGIPAKHPFEKGSRKAEPLIKAEFDVQISKVLGGENKVTKRNIGF